MLMMFLFPLFLFEMVDSLMSGESRSGIAIVDPSPVNIHAAVEHALNQHALQRSVTLKPSNHHVKLA